MMPVLTPPKKRLENSVVSPLVDTPHNPSGTGAGRINARVGAEREGRPGWRAQSPYVCGHTPCSTSESPGPEYTEEDHMLNKYLNESP